MKRMIYAAIAVLMILSGCEYHPYYDGQQFRVYHADCGLLETDGGHLDLPIVSPEPYVLECYGGKGKSHSIEIADPEYLGYSYTAGEIRKTFADGTEVYPACITLLPEKKGETSIVITDNDTGESIRIDIEICDGYKFIEVVEGVGTFEAGMLFAFEYGKDDGAVRICKGSIVDREFEPVADGTCGFVSVSDTLYMELTYQHRSSKYMILHGDGSVSDPEWMMKVLNMEDRQFTTRSYHGDADLLFVDVTDLEKPYPDKPEGEYFYARSARFIPWGSDPI